MRRSRTRLGQEGLRCREPPRVPLRLARSDGLLADARSRRRRRHRPDPQQPRRLAALGLLLREVRRDRAAARPALARAARRQPGRAVAFNAYWKDCHVDPGGRRGGRARDDLRRAARALLSRRRAARHRRATASARSSPATTRRRSSPLLRHVDDHRGPVQPLWPWGGFLLRPDNFDELVAERYGSASAPAATRIRGRARTRTRRTAAPAGCPRCSRRCATPTARGAARSASPATRCHSGAAQRASYAAGGGSSLAGSEPVPARLAAARLPAVARGAREPEPHARHQQRERHQPGVPLPRRGHAAARQRARHAHVGLDGDMDTPAWWNMGHRPVKFVDGVFPMDAPRVDMVFYTPFFGLFGSLGGPISEAGQDWMRQTRPRPEHLDRGAEGARLSRPRSTPRSPSRARCSSTRSTCGRRAATTRSAARRGQRLVRELPRRLRAALRERPDFLATPALEGIASYITPQRIIGTDPVRAAHQQRGGADRRRQQLLRLPADGGHGERLRPAEPRRPARQPRARLPRAAALRRLGDGAVPPQRLGAERVGGAEARGPQAALAAQVEAAALGPDRPRRSWATTPSMAAPTTPRSSAGSTTPSPARTRRSSTRSRRRTCAATPTTICLLRWYDQILDRPLQQRRCWPGTSSSRRPSRTPRSRTARSTTPHVRPGQRRPRVQLGAHRRGAPAIIEYLKTL